MTLVAALLVVAAAVVALEGLGALAFMGAGRLAGASLPFDRPGIRGAAGVAVLAFVAGIAAPAGVPMLVPFYLLAVVGLGGAAWTWWGERPAAADRRVLPIRIAVLVVLGAWITTWNLAQPIWNLCDDWVAYLPFGDALLHGHGLDQPFSQRRIGTLGAFLPLQFIGSIPFGPYAAQLADAVVCPLLAATAVLWAGRGRAGLLLGAAGAVGAALGATGRINLGPSGVAVLLILALGLVAVESTALGGRARMVAAGVAGVLGATLIACRLHYAVVALVPVAVVALGGARGARWRRAGVAVGAGVLAAAGWMIAGWQASGTPLFPVLGSGTINPDWDGYDDPAVHGLGVLYGRALDLLTYADTWFVLAATAAVALAVVLHRHERARFLVPLLMVAATAVLVAIFPSLLTTSSPPDGWRLTRPLVLATVLVLTACLAREVGRARREWSVSVAAVAGALLVLSLAQVPWSAVIGQLRDLGGGVEAAADFETDPDSPLRGDYAAAAREIPAEAEVAVAVDRPALLRDAGSRTLNLDIVGANAPGPGMPWFAGAQAKVDYLRDQGISYLVTVDAGVSECLYRRTSWQANLTGPERVYQLWAPWFLDWLHDADAIASRPGTTVHGPLRVTPLG